MTSIKKVGLFQPLTPFGLYLLVSKLRAKSFSGLFTGSLYILRKSIARLGHHNQMSLFVSIYKACESYLDFWFLLISNFLKHKAQKKYFFYLQFHSQRHLMTLKLLWVQRKKRFSLSRWQQATLTQQKESKA